MALALTREYKDTVLARIQRDSKFARALYVEAVNALFEGETDEALSILRDPRARRHYVQYFEIMRG